MVTPGFFLTLWLLCWIIAECYASSVNTISHRITAVCLWIFMVNTAICDKYLMLLYSCSWLYGIEVQKTEQCSIHSQSQLFSLTWKKRRSYIYRNSEHPVWLTIMLLLFNFSEASEWMAVISYIMYIALA